MAKGLSVVNQQQKLSERADWVSDCRKSGLSVRAWCQENDICEQTYYRWQRRLYELTQNQQENRFAEVMPWVLNRSGIAVTVQLGGVDLAIHNGADAATVEAVLRAVKSPPFSWSSNAPGQENPRFLSNILHHAKYSRKGEYVKGVDPLWP